MQINPDAIALTFFFSKMNPIYHISQGTEDLL